LGQRWVNDVTDEGTTPLVNRAVVERPDNDVVVANVALYQLSYTPEGTAMIVVERELADQV
jgi:hypothetical protein